MKRIFIPIVLYFLYSSNTALGYPSYIAFSYNKCLSCHRSPTGGGKVNGYGKSFLAPAYPNHLDLVSYLRGDDSEEKKQTIELGGQFRDLILRKEYPSDLKSKNLFVPMLTEINLLASKERLSFYGALSIKEKENQREKEFVAHWRELWVLWEPLSHLYFKLGQTTPAFGLKTPDHTRLTRVVMNLGKYDQTSGVEISYLTKLFFTSVFFYPSEFNNPRGLKGSLASLEIYPNRHSALGASYLKDAHYKQKRNAQSVFLRIKPLPRFYLLGEMDWVFEKENTRSLSLSYENNSQVTFVKAGWFPKEWWELWLIGSQRKSTNLVTEDLFRIGVAQKTFSWLRLEFFVDQYYNGGKRGRRNYAVQIHGHI